MQPRIQDMHPDLRIKYAAFAAKMGEAGVPFALTCVLRTPGEQFAYACQGRSRETLLTFLREHRAAISVAFVEEHYPVGMSPLVFTNTVRKKAGMDPLGISDQGCVVTKTLQSLHFPDSRGWSHAFDFAVLKNGRVPTWDLKWDGDKDNITDYEEAAHIAETCALEAGGHWGGTFKDWPHIQLKSA